MKSKISGRFPSAFRSINIMEKSYRITRLKVDHAEPRTMIHSADIYPRDLVNPDARPGGLI